MLTIDLQILNNIEIQEGETWDYADKVPVKGKLFDFNTETNQDLIFSSKGRIFNLKSGKIVGSGKSGKYNYFTFKLKNGKNKSMGAHRPIAYTFSNDDNNYSLSYTVNHIDGNPDNNSADNLEIVSHSENIKHAYENGLIKRKMRAVVQLSKDNDFIKEYDSIISASRATNICRYTIGSVCRKKHKTAGNYRWVYKEEYEKLLNKKSYN